jgi:lactate dehydrogenase-like 2-hydroxyacid dehydrogenase
MFDELLVKSDIISLHCPLFENNRGMIKKRHYQQNERWRYDN